MATFRELINEVLIRLREDTIATDWSGNINDSTTVTDYQKVIGSLINDSKRNIESYHDWLVLRETVDVTTVSGTRNYNLSSGQEIKIIDVINQTQGTHLVQVSRQYINSTKYPSSNSGDPLYYAFNGADSSNNLKVDLEPIPNSVQTLSFDIVKPQAELATATTVLKIPEKPVMLGSWMRAIAERGEDGGTQTGIVAAEVAESLNQAVILDSGNVQYESDWYIN
uniref:Uncharacterized protein n=1 Tax=uncultured marine virus TaxID=186617 RepID=A0A0F7L1K1_9VIRU|nr:hypothetical protein [uncultured marine virus]